MLNQVLGSAVRLQMSFFLGLYFLLLGEELGEIQTIYSLLLGLYDAQRWQRYKLLLASDTEEETPIPKKSYNGVAESIQLQHTGAMEEGDADCSALLKFRERFPAWQLLWAFIVGAVYSRMLGSALWLQQAGTLVI